MKKEVRLVDEKSGIVQITTEDERFYKVGELYLPSVTWVLSFVYKDKYFIEWVAKNGIQESENIKNAKGLHGSIVHSIANDLLLGNSIIYTDDYILNGRGYEITPSIWEAVLSFQRWYKENNVELIHSEILVHDDKTAGTVDLICRINDETWLIDFKTSKSVFLTHKIQVSAYKRMYKDKIDKIGILQLGYNLNKKGFKLTEVEDCVNLFDSAYNFWEHETNEKPYKQKDYPLSIKL